MRENSKKSVRRQAFTRTKIERRKNELRTLWRKKVVNRREDKHRRNKNEIQRFVSQTPTCHSENAPLQSLALQEEKSNLLPLLEVPASVDIPLVDRLDNLYEFEVVQNMFSSTSRSFEVTDIFKVKNSYLRFQYEQKKIQAMWKYGSVMEQLLFHGTRKDNITSICQNNFDWRLYKKHKFGIGVNFATTSSYAAHYCDEDPDKVMIISRVIIGNSCYWSESMPWPPEPYDTVINQNESVVVKFEDHSFYPEYLVYFRSF